jgi:hypothetical protein
LPVRPQHSDRAFLLPLRLQPAVTGQGRLAAHYGVTGVLRPLVDAAAAWKQGAELLISDHQSVARRSLL